MTTSTGCTPERIQKIISKSGLLSRRNAEEAIRAGRICVNGVPAQIGQSANISTDHITLDGALIEVPKKTVVLALHKPKFVITTKSDPQGRKTVMEFIPEPYQVNPIGRLDFASTGLLLFTNDGELHQKLAHPTFNIQKIYIAEVEGTPTKGVLKRLTTGVPLKDGPGKFDHVRVLSSSNSNTTLEVTVSEGRNRFVRRMLSYLGHPVHELKRIQIGSLKLGSLLPGQIKEIKDLDLILD